MSFRMNNISSKNRSKTLFHALPKVSKKITIAAKNRLSQIEIIRSSTKVQHGGNEDNDEHAYNDPLSAERTTKIDVQMLCREKLLEYDPNLIQKENQILKINAQLQLDKIK
jgi:hypothetical protein